MYSKRRKDSPPALANRLYKQKIYPLCEKANKGDKSAELELASELEKNTVAAWAVKHWNKLQKGKARRNAARTGGNPVPKLATAKKPTYGNAYRPYQGGAFGSGKKS